MYILNTYHLWLAAERAKVNAELEEQRGIKLKADLKKRLSTIGNTFGTNLQSIPYPKNDYPKDTYVKLEDFEFGKSTPMSLPKDFDPFVN